MILRKMNRQVIKQTVEISPIMILSVVVNDLSRDGVFSFSIVTIVADKFPEVFHPVLPRIPVCRFNPFFSKYI